MPEQALDHGVAVEEVGGHGHGALAAHREQLTVADVLVHPGDGHRQPRGHLGHRQGLDLIGQRPRQLP